MKLPVFLLLLPLILHYPVFAHNFYNTNPEEEEKNARDQKQNLPSISYTFNTDFAEQFVAYFDLEDPTLYSFQDLSDAAIYLTHLGETQKALNLLQWLHQKHPEEYNITANLGAVHELEGDLDSAEYYIRKAIDLSTNKTPKSEWVNLKIIHAKRNIQNNPDWLLHHNVLNLNWDTSIYNKSLTIEHNSAALQDSLRFVRYQTYQNQFDSLWHIGSELKKRIPYYDPPNLLIANIMGEIADYFAMSLSIKDAFVAYKIALHYDPKNKLNKLAALEELMPHFRKYEFDEAIFEQYFHPSLAFREKDKKHLPQYRGSFNKQQQHILSPLFWQAGLALLIVLLILGRVLWLDRKGFK